MLRRAQIGHLEMRTKNGTQLSSYVSLKQVDWLQRRARANETSVSSEIRAILDAEMRADEVRSEIERCLA